MVTKGENVGCGGEDKLGAGTDITHTITCKISNQQDPTI